MTEPTTFTLTYVSSAQHCGQAVGDDHVSYYVPARVVDDFKLTEADVGRRFRALYFASPQSDRRPVIAAPITWETDIPDPATLTPLARQDELVKIVDRIAEAVDDFYAMLGMLEAAAPEVSPPPEAPTPQAAARQRSPAK